MYTFKYYVQALMFGKILTVQFVHLLQLGGQLDPNNIKGISINFVCSNCIY